MQVPPADTFQLENENEDERVHTNQSGSSLYQGIHNDTLYGSSISQQIHSDTLHGSPIPQGGDNNTLHGSCIPQGGDNDRASATWFKLKVPSAFQGITYLIYFPLKYQRTNFYISGMHVTLCSLLSGAMSNSLSIATCNWIMAQNTIVSEC